jgi:hypothetical protein
METTEKCTSSHSFNKFTCKNFCTASKFRIFDNLALVWGAGLKKFCCIFVLYWEERRDTSFNLSLQKYVFLNITTDWLEMGV